MSWEMTSILLVGGPHDGTEMTVAMDPESRTTNEVRLAGHTYRATRSHREGKLVFTFVEAPPPATAI